MKSAMSYFGGAVLGLLLTGCGEKAADPLQPAAKPDVATEDNHDHDHHGAGPHGGTVADWGGGAYHVEFIVDHPKQEATVYVLGSDGKSPAPIKASELLLSIDDPSFQVELAADPLKDETDGVASRFVGKHEHLGKVQEFAGTISGEVEGTPYAGDFKEEAEHHKH